MSNDELLTDDYVANLLAQDAKDCSLRYSAMGMEAFRDNKKPSNIPKPNTRFLRHIIRNTDTHNKALLAKEAAESRARLKDLEHAEEVKRRKTNPNAKDIRKRQMGNIHAILGGKKRRRDSQDDADGSTRRDDQETRDARKSSRRSNDLIGRGDEKRRHGRLSERDFAEHDAGSRSDEGKKSRRSRRHESSDQGERGHRHGRSSRKDRSKSPRRHRSSCSPDERKRRHRHRSHHRSRSRETSHPRKKDAPTAADEDSDPLEDLIGPAPPPKYRGRGTIGGAVGLDRRFSESYDPKLDVQMDDEEDASDDAVEAFRDRQKLRLHQDKRLKDAGFTDEQIERAKAPTDKPEEDVVWSKAGEKREWDKGKGLGLDGADEDEHHPATLFSEDY